MATPQRNPEDKEGSSADSGLTLCSLSSINTKEQMTGDFGSTADKPVIPSLPRNAPEELMLYGKSLTLCCSDINGNASVPRTQVALSKDPSQEGMTRKKVAFSLAMIVPGSTKELDEKRKMSISTELKLYEDPWKIRKTLSKHDTGKVVFMEPYLIKNHILPFLQTGAITAADNPCGARVCVWDLDTRTEHTLVLKRWSLFKYYVFNDTWRRDFVRRKELKEGDEIGFYWDSHYSRIHFAVLKRGRQS